MPSLSPARIAHLVSPYLAALPQPAPESLFPQLSLYLELLLKWNARTSLTAIRDPEQIVVRHFGESLFAATHLPSGVSTVLDLGSGAGFPGLPLQLLHPHLQVTLAESQGKKASFLREAVRLLGLTTGVHAGRAEDLVGKASFDLVALRAVDNMARAVPIAKELARHAVCVLTTLGELDQLSPARATAFPDGSRRVLAFLEADT